MDRPLAIGVSASLIFHGVLIGSYVHWIRLQKARGVRKVIARVDLLDPESVAPRIRKPTAAPKGRKSAMDFLKMALPEIPKEAPPIRIAKLMPLEQNRLEEMKLPEPRRKMGALDGPERLVERKADLAPKIQLQEGQRRPDSGSLADAVGRTLPSRPQAEFPGLAPLRLEEVGAARAPELPKGLSLDNRSGEPARVAQNLEDINQWIAQKKVEGRPPSGSPQGLDEASLPPVRRKAIVALPVAAEGGRPSAERAIEKTAPSAAEMEDVSQQLASLLARKPEPGFSPQEKARKKPVDIIGPLSNRKVLHRVLPAFPQWARDKGILEMEVAIRFFVSPKGVVEWMRTERTSGYPQLDKLAMDALEQWRFAALGDMSPAGPEAAGASGPGAGPRQQWGVVSFRFILE
ncbi:MAG: TonB family protein [Elusimicrobia bacterium]|nr:TonB family protein [Elusimicrobiota bacterium]